MSSGSRKTITESVAIFRPSFRSPSWSLIDFTPVNLRRRANRGLLLSVFAAAFML
jgi:hypothetical protein